MTPGLIGSEAIIFSNSVKIMLANTGPRGDLIETPVSRVLLGLIYWGGGAKLWHTLRFR